MPIAPPNEFGLDLHHLRDLRNSGLTDETIRECGFHTEHSYSKLAVMIGWKRYPKKMGSALVIPFRGLDGELSGYKRIKPSNPKNNRNGKPQKYIAPKGLPHRPYFPPGVIGTLSDPSIPLLIAEGEKKAAAATQEGFPCIGLTGVFCFNTKGEARLCPELQQVAWQGRDVRIVYDSDLNENKKVADAESRLAAQLSQQGAKVKVIRLPDGPNGEKLGVDDFLLKHGKVEFAKLYDAAEDPEPVDAGEVYEEFEASMVALDFLRIHCVEDKEYKLRFHREDFWVWKHGRYVRIPDSDLRCDIRKFVDEKFTKVSVGMVSNVLDALKAETHVAYTREQPCWLDGSASSKEWISFANGIGNIAMMAEDTHTLRKSTPVFFTSVALPYEYDPNAECLRWFDFLTHNLEGDAKRIELLQEWFGYCLIPSTQYQKFLMLYGEGGTGKSVTCAALRGLLGETNCSSVPLEQFGEKFSLVQSIGKLANIAADTGELDKTAEGYLKSFTSGDKMQFERKMKQPFEAIPTARLIIATNNLPRFSDRSSGIWRRLSLIPFDVMITDDKKVRGMDDPQWWLTNGELPGMFNWALQGLIRLQDQGGFTRSEKCDAIIEDYRVQSNPARAFLNEHYVEGSNGFAITADIYDEYSKWCERNGYRRLSSGVFGREITRTFPLASSERRRTSDGRVAGYAGIYRNPESD